MTGVGHAIVGTAVTVATLVVLDVPPLSAEFALATFYGFIASLLPDIDGGQNLLKSLVRAKDQPRIVRLFFGRMPRKRGLFKSIYILLGMIEVTARSFLVRILNFLDWLLPHRGPTHYLATAFLLDYLIYRASLAYGFSAIYSIAFTAGYISHILADSLTRAGVPLLGPFYRHRLHLLPKPMRIYTKRGMSASERLWVALILCGAFCAGYFL